MVADGRAVVLGASMAGLLAARALADGYRDVWLVERDQLANDVCSAPRPGVPHGRHAHGLLAGGRRAIEQLLPGAAKDLIGHGAPSGDAAGQVRACLHGGRLCQVEIGQLGIAASRPLLESYVRSRVLGLPNVHLIDGCDVTGLEWHDSAVVGARIQRRAPGSTPEVIRADLVVDATGRGSRTGRWLVENGYEAPLLERLEIGLTYTSRQFELAPGRLAGDITILVSPTRARPRGGVVQQMEQGRSLVTLFGVLGDRAPIELDGFREFAQTLPVPYVHEAIADAIPCGEPVTFHFPSSARYRYERLRRFPAGLLVIGDAICSFNPQYGQGMTVAAMQAEVLRRMMPSGVRARRFFRAVAPIIDVPWRITTGGDLSLPQVPGERSRMVRFMNAYLGRFHTAARTDAALAAAFARVANLIAAPALLMRPDLVARVLLRGGRGQDA